MLSFAQGPHAIFTRRHSSTNSVNSAKCHIAVADERAYSNSPDIRIFTGRRGNGVLDRLYISSASRLSAVELSMSSRILVLIYVAMVAILIERNGVTCGALECHICENEKCQAALSESTANPKDCDKCGTMRVYGVITKRFCGKAGGDVCEEKSDVGPGTETECCTTPKCNNEVSPASSIKCNTCTGTNCPGTLMQADKCAACVKVEANGVLTDLKCDTLRGPCKKANPAGTTCCYDNLCNVPSPAATLIKCYKCSAGTTACPDPITTAVAQDVQCNKCMKKVEKGKIVEAKCSTEKDPCIEKAADGISCCELDLCNGVVADVKSVKCYTCSAGTTACPDPFTTAVAQVVRCAKCSKKVQNGKIVEAKCSSLSDPCIEKTADGITCCDSDLCNSGMTHSVVKSVLVGSLILVIGSFSY